MHNTTRTLIPHITATGIALTYAWFIFNSPFVKTGLQFVAPVILILLTHLIWLTLSGQLKRGFANVAIKRTSNTTLIMALGIVAFALFAPQPATAQGLGETVQMLLGVAMCLAMLAAVLFVLFLLLRGLIWIFRKIFKRGGNDENRLNDFGTMTFALITLSIASLEGLPNTFAFTANNTSTASVTINASSATVWHTMQTATSPEIPLPYFLSNFPRPTNVTIDEGTTLGANRQVKFQGREGVGYLSLRVMENSETSATFHVLSDTSPIANWVTHKTLSYTTHTIGDETRLDVTLNFDRDLAPAWFFNPVMKFAGKLAMGVLANDVKNRAENPNAT
jgi:hypothetical protein